MSELSIEELSINEETKKHIRQVQRFINQIVSELQERAILHDESKLEHPEVEGFAEYTPKLAQVEYGSEDYKRYLGEMKRFLNHHYLHNRHHPEHFDEDLSGEKGMNGMNLIDLIEMFCDWKAATLRMKTPDFAGSIAKNKERFNYPDMLEDIFINTMRWLDWEIP